MAALRYLEGTVTLRLDTEACVGCGMCLDVCPHGIFAMEGEKAVVADLGACMECGACARNCPVDAISVQAGVGCAVAVIRGALRGTEPCCDCSQGKGACCS